MDEQTLDEICKRINRIFPRQTSGSDGTEMRGPSPISLVGEDFEPAAVRREVTQPIVTFLINFTNFPGAHVAKLPAGDISVMIVRNFEQNIQSDY